MHLFSSNLPFISSQSFLFVISIILIISFDINCFSLSLSLNLKLIKYSPVSELKTLNLQINLPSSLFLLVSTQLLLFII